jgi:hypothetical protein
MTATHQPIPPRRRAQARPTRSSNSNMDGGNKVCFNKGLMFYGSNPDYSSGFLKLLADAA